MKTTLAGGSPPPPDAFVTRLSPSGAISYSTFLGGSDGESGEAIALDAEGNVYAGGLTQSSDFQVKGGVPADPGAGFVTKLNLNRSGAAALVYSSLLGGRVIDLAVDAAGNCYLLLSSGPSLQATPGAYQVTPGPNFLAKLNPAGSALVYATYLGGQGIHAYTNLMGTFTQTFSDSFSGLAVDATGNAYLTGTASVFTKFKTTPDAFQREAGACFLTPHTPAFGCQDAFVMKLNASGSALVYSSFLGGYGADDFGYGLTVGADGAVYVTGETNSASQGTFPVTPNALPRTNQNRFIAKFSLTDSISLLANVSAASFSGLALAPESIVAAFGAGLATTTQSADSLPLPTSLAGVTVKVEDNSGIERLAPLFFVSPGQINYLIPPGTVVGPARVSVTSGDTTVATELVKILPAAPGLFAANANGQGVAAAVVQRKKPDNTDIYEPVARFDAAQNEFVPAPIDLGPETDQVFLALFGTGLRHRINSTVGVSIGGLNVEVLYAGPQPNFMGLDQVNVRLPRSLVGRGEVGIMLTVDGQAANTVLVSFK